MPEPPEIPEETRVWLEGARERLAQMEVVEPANLGRPMAMPRRINWGQLAKEAGVVTRRFPEGGFMTSTGSKQARNALELLLGSDNIREAVRLVLNPYGEIQRCS